MTYIIPLNTNNYYDQLHQGDPISYDEMSVDSSVVRMPAKSEGDFFGGNDVSPYFGGDTVSYPSPDPYIYPELAPYT